MPVNNGINQITGCHAFLSGQVKPIDIIEALEKRI